MPTLMTDTRRNQGSMLKRLPLATLPWPRTKLFSPRVPVDMRSLALQIMVILPTNAELPLSRRNLKHPSTYLVASISLSLTRSVV